MTFLPEIGRKCAGEFLPNGRAVAGSNDGHDRNVGEIEPPLDAEQRGRRIDLSKRRRIAWLSDSDEARAQTLGDCKLGCGVFLAAKADGCARHGATARAARRWRPLRRRIR